jgi:hypothetical protein
MPVPMEPVPQTGGVTAKPEMGVRGRFSGNGGAQRPPAGEDAVERPFEAEDDELENAAERAAVDGAEPAEDDDFDDEPQEEKPSDKEFLQMVSEATSQAEFYSNQINRRAWERAYKAYRQEHFHGSKYTTPDFRNRSKLFIPKTRSAVRKDLAATSASLFGTVDPVECEPGNESDPLQAGNAAIVKEMLKYRTDSANGKAAMKWFQTAMGARQTSLMTGFCVTKQHWKLTLRRETTEEVEGEDGEMRQRDVYKPFIDRPECLLIPPENCVIDPACDWTDPSQDSAYFIIKYPMRIDEIRQNQRNPLNPWRKLSESVLRSAGEGAKMEAASIRRARDQGLDRFEQSSNSKNFDVIWVYETFVRTAGEDWTFISISDKALLTDIRPVREVYPEQNGERPITFGYGSFEAFCVFPQAAVESWQMLQQEANDVRNLTLDAFKQNVMPVTKVVRGRQIDLDQLKRRGQGTSIMVTDQKDVTWERPPDVPAAAQFVKQQLDIDFDDLAGQQNYGTVQDNNALGKTLGGLKLAAGAANAVQEFDIRVWIETWAEPAVRQIVRLEQYYESDEAVLALCGERAKLFEKHKITTIDDDLLENDVTVRISVGLGAGDPMQRLQKFQSATSIALPLLQMDPDFISGKKRINSEAMMQEVYGGVGYRDGGKRFITEGEEKPSDPNVAAMADETAANAQLKRAQADKAKTDAKKGIIEALTKAAGVGIQLKGLDLDQIKTDFDQSVTHMDQVGKAMELGHSQGLALKAAQMAAQGLNVDGSPIDMPGTAPGPDYPDGKVPPEVLGDVPGEAPASAAPAPAAGGDAPAPAAPSQPGQPPGLNDLMAPPAEKPAPAAAEAAPAKRKHKIKITGRDPVTGRANAFEAEET